MPEPTADDPRGVQSFDYSRYVPNADAAEGNRAALRPGPWLEKLAQAWSEAYRRLGGSPEIVRVEQGGFSYLFDTADGRAIAGFGFVGSVEPAPRDNSRAAGYPASLERGYQKGHLIAHRLGGGLDINLFHQLGAANIGPFRRLEKEAALNPGCFYFVRLLYAAASDERPDRNRHADPQRPRWIEQGLILPRPPYAFTLRAFEN